MGARSGLNKIREPLAPQQIRLPSFIRRSNQQYRWSIWITLAILLVQVLGFLGSATFPSSRIPLGKGTIPDSPRPPVLGAGTGAGRGPHARAVGRAPPPPGYLARRGGPAYHPPERVPAVSGSGKAAPARPRAVPLCRRPPTLTAGVRVPPPARGVHPPLVAGHAQRGTPRAADERYRSICRQSCCAAAHLEVQSGAWL